MRKKRLSKLTFLLFNHFLVFLRICSMLKNLFRMSEVRQVKDNPREVTMDTTTVANTRVTSTTQDKGNRVDRHGEC